MYQATARLARVVALRVSIERAAPNHAGSTDCLPERTGGQPAATRQFRSLPGAGHVLDQVEEAACVAPFVWPSL
jgi:hypothetical protein